MKLEFREDRVLKVDLELKVKGEIKDYRVFRELGIKVLKVFRV